MEGLVSEQMFLHVIVLTRLIEMEKNDVDERLIRWNYIFGELLIDANALVKDLWENINYIAIFGVFMIFLGVAALTLLPGLGAKYMLTSSFIFTMWGLFGVLLLWRWYGLRSRYNRFRSLRKEMESS